MSIKALKFAKQNDNVKLQEVLTSYTIETVSEKYFEVAKKLRGASDTTISAYKSDYKQLLVFLKQNGYPNDIRYINAGMIEEFLAEIRGKSRSINTVHRKKDSVSTLFKYAVKKGWIDKNPVEAIEIERRKKNRRNTFLTIEETRGFVSASVDVKGYSQEMLMSANLTLVLTGVRESELRKLEWPDVDFKKGTISIYNSKNTNKKDTIDKLDRTIPMADKLKEELLRNYCGQTEGPVFTNKKGKRITKDSLSELVKRSRQAAGIREKITPHDLRHNFASWLEKLGATQSDREFLLGHQPQSTVGGYTHTNIDRVRQFVEAFAEKIFCSEVNNAYFKTEVTDHSVEPLIMEETTMKEIGKEDDGTIKAHSIKAEFKSITFGPAVISEAQKHWNSIRGDCPMSADFLIGYIIRKN